MPDLTTSSELATALGVTDRTVRRYATAVGCKPTGRNWVFSAADVRRIKRHAAEVEGSGRPRKGLQAASPVDPEKKG